MGVTNWIIDTYKSLSKDETFEEYAISIFGIITTCSVILFVMGFIEDKLETILFVNFGLKIFISLYLIYKYNPFQKNNLHFTNLDRKIVFSLSIYNILVSFSDIILLYVTDVRNFFIKIYTGGSNNTITQNPMSYNNNILK